MIRIRQLFRMGVVGMAVGLAWLPATCNLSVTGDGLALSFPGGDLELTGDNLSLDAGRLNLDMGRDRLFIDAPDVLVDIQR